MNFFVKEAETFFSKNKGSRTFFEENLGGGGEEFFTNKFENPRFIEEQKVIYVGSSDSSVFHWRIIYTINT